MLRAGCPAGTAGVLAGLMKKMRGMKLKEALQVLHVVHPRIMENLKIGSGWCLIRQNRKYVWHRGDGWA